MPGEDLLPFALSEQQQPKSVSLSSPSLVSPRGVETFGSELYTCSQSNSAPGLSETQVGESTALTTAADNAISASTTKQIDLMTSSLQTTISDVASSTATSRGAELQGSYPYVVHRNGAGSVGFSQLLDAADDTRDIPIDRSEVRMQPRVDHWEEAHALEHKYAEGTLIAPSMELSSAAHRQQWFPWLNTGSHSLHNASHEALSAPLVSFAPSQHAVEQSRVGIVASLVDDRSFQISTPIDSAIAPSEILSLLSDPDFLKLWCEPIISLVVTSRTEGSSSSSTVSIDGGRQSRRVYEGEWIQATTNSLISPPSYATSISGGQQIVLDRIGFTTFGRLSMFVERSRCKVGLTLGPFVGGIEVSHSFSVLEEDGRVKIFDRVRLKNEEKQDSSFLAIAKFFTCGAIDAIDQCMQPTVTDYMEQTSSSMARFRYIVENGNYR